MEASVSHFRAGRLDEAIEAAGAELRMQPLDAKLRTFLFELLCFAGDFDRAEKQLAVLGGQSSAADAGATLLKGLLQAHRTREETFAAAPPIAEDKEYRGSLMVNGTKFAGCADEDPRVGASLEVYQGMSYHRIPYREVERVTIAAPASLRDLLWIPATIALKPSAEAADTEMLAHLPALAPQSFGHSDAAVKLGRLSVVEEDERGVPLPFGTKLLICGSEGVSLLDVRSLVFPAAEE
jgi:type VI secretion system protein ImpE